MHHDGSNSARARSARIRTAHDYEATELDSMRRAGEVARQQPQRVSLMARVAAAFRRGGEPSHDLDPGAEVDVVSGGEA